MFFSIYLQKLLSLLGISIVNSWMEQASILHKVFTRIVGNSSIEKMMLIKQSQVITNINETSRQKVPRSAFYLHLKGYPFLGPSKILRCTRVLMCYVSVLFRLIAKLALPTILFYNGSPSPSTPFSSRSRAAFATKLQKVL